MNLQSAREKFALIKDKLKMYQYALSLTHWDLSTLTPQTGKPFAAKVLGMLSGEAFDLQMSPEMKNILNIFKENEFELTNIEKRELELFTDEIEVLEKIPKQEYQDYQELKSVAQFVWEKAKNEDDFDSFAPYLEKLVETTRRFAKLRKPDEHPYNVCLGDYEKGLTTDDLDKFFSAIKEKTVPLVERIAKEGREVREDFVYRTYPAKKQEEVSYKLLELIGFNFESGIMAESEHPFTLDLNEGDVRLTTHFYENLLTSSMLSSVHEGGHGIYEQNAKISPIIKDSSLTSGTAMSIHESQSRFYENTIARSKGFWEYFFPILQEAYPEQLQDVSMEEMYRAINISKPGLIRIEADELTYNLHIMIRYEIEKDLIEGNIKVKDLPEIWNAKYKEYMGIVPESNSKGVLQDVHWSGGMFGYFPSYALGNAYAAQIKHTMDKDINIDELCRTGNLAPIKQWLNENIHQFGKLKTPKQLIKDITGEDLNPEYLNKYLAEKFEEIYF